MELCATQRLKSPSRCPLCVSKHNQRQIGWDRHVHGGLIERLEHELRHVLQVGRIESHFPLEVPICWKV